MSKKVKHLENQIVNVETPDRGIGPGIMTLLLSHPSKGEKEVAKDIKDAWSKQEEEEWESDDTLCDKLKEMGYTVHKSSVIWVEV